jgi:hypothetical protein
MYAGFPRRKSGRITTSAAVRRHICRCSRTRLRPFRAHFLRACLRPLPAPSLILESMVFLAYHSRLRADPKAQMLPANPQKHNEVCCLITVLWVIPFVNCTGVPYLITCCANIENYTVMKKFELCRQREQAQGVMAPQPMTMHASDQPGEATMPMAHQAPPTGAKFDPMTGQPIPMEHQAPPTGAKFDPMTGKPIPKFDPETGVQNWDA